MKLTLEGLKDAAAWEEAGIRLPSYDIRETSRLAKEHPRWVHFGIGNIFRVFIGGIADDLLEKGYLDRGITCAEAFDFDVVDKIYLPHDNLALSVILKCDGTRDLKVLGGSAEVIRAIAGNADEWERLKKVFADPSLQMVSFTITEKGYALKGTDGRYFPFIQKDLEQGPDFASSAMAIVTAMLLERYKNGRLPLALVSMDNVSHNGDMLRNSVLEVASEWVRRGFAKESFLSYVSDTARVAFPWTMIDKITPRPARKIADELEAAGIEGMQPTETSKRTYIAPFANAEGPQYLVIEDSFPNGRPALEHGKGVYMADRITVDLAERMKVTACLNPVHSALGPLGVVAGIDLFADLMTDAVFGKMARTVAYGEGMPVIQDPVILSPKAFTDELFSDRFPNRYLGDVNLRLCTDVTQGFSVRFGETIKSYAARYGSAERLWAIPLGIAGCMRYMMGVDDFGKAFELAPDPLVGELHERLSGIELGRPETFKGQLRPVLSNENLFGVDLYRAGLGEKIEGMFREMIAGYGAARSTVERYFG